MAIRKIIIFVVATTCLYAGSVNAAEVFIGVSTHWALLKGQDGVTGNDVSEPESNREIELALSVKSLETYFADSSFGYYLEFGRDAYAVERIRGGAGAEIKSTLSGDYWFVTPTVFYNFGSKDPESWSFKVGAGLGMGYLSGDGTIVFDGPALPPRSVDGNDFDITVGVMVEYEYKKWVVLLKEFAPNASIDGVDFKLELPTLIVGYRFDL